MAKRRGKGKTSRAGRFKRLRKTNRAVKTGTAKPDRQAHVRGIAQTDTPLKSSAGAGRPRQEGERYACGKLKPAIFSPGHGTLRERMERLGASIDFFSGKTTTTAAQLHSARSPLSLAQALGLLTTEELESASRYAALYRAAGVALPSVKVADLTRVRGSDNRDGDARAQEQLRVIWGALLPDPLALIELSTVCLQDEWPIWLKPVGVTARDLERLDALKRGLAMVRTVLGAPKPKAKRMPANDDRPRPSPMFRLQDPARPEGEPQPGPIRETRVLYVNDAGDEVLLDSPRSAFAEVYLRGRRRA